MARDYDHLFKLLIIGDSGKLLWVLSHFFGTIFFIKFAGNIEMIKIKCLITIQQ